MTFIALLAFLLIAGGFVAWRIQEADDSVSDSSVATESSSQSTLPSEKSADDDTVAPEEVVELEKFTSTLASDMIVFDVPNGWAVSEKKDDYYAYVTVSNTSSELTLELVPNPGFFGSAGYSCYVKEDLVKIGDGIFRFKDEANIKFSDGIDSNDDNWASTVEDADITNDITKADVNFCSSDSPLIVNMESKFWLRSAHLSGNKTADDVTDADAVMLEILR